MTGPVTHTGTKKTGLNVSVANEARKHTKLNQEKKDLIRIAITRKTSKAYPENTGLLVYFDDYVAFSRYKDEAVMEGFLEELDVSWTEKFSALYLVGASGNQIWERYRSEQGA
jgi:spore coat polysaccharide biosynthesis predicted glycosyltransferase SpsG